MSPTLISLTLVIGAAIISASAFEGGKAARVLKVPLEGDTAHPISGFYHSFKHYARWYTVDSPNGAVMVRSVYNKTAWAVKNAAQDVISVTQNVGLGDFGLVYKDTKLTAGPIQNNGSLVANVDGLADVTVTASVNKDGVAELDISTSLLDYMGMRIDVSDLGRAGKRFRGGALEKLRSLLMDAARAGLSEVVSRLVVDNLEKAFGDSSEVARRILSDGVKDLPALPLAPKAQ